MPRSRAEYLGCLLSLDGVCRDIRLPVCDSTASGDFVHPRATRSVASLKNGIQRSKCILEGNGQGRSIVIDVRGLTKVIDTGVHRVEIVRGSTSSIPAGQLAAIMGASGSGKRFLSRSACGPGYADFGPDYSRWRRIRACGRQVGSGSRPENGFVFQSYQLIPTFTAEENVLLPYELVGSNGGRRTPRG